MTKKDDDTLAALKTKKSEKRRKVAEATGRILMDLNGAYVECNCIDQSFTELNEVVAKVIEQIKECDNKVVQRAAG